MKRKILSITAAAMAVCVAFALAGCSSAPASNTNAGANTNATVSPTAPTNQTPNGPTPSESLPSVATILQSFTCYYQDGTLMSTTLTYENGSVTSETVNQGGTITKAAYADYDAIGMPWAETINNARYDFTCKVNSIGLPVERTVKGSAITYKYEYYPNNFPKSQAVYNVADGALLTEVEYDQLGYITSVTNSYGDLSTYTYLKDAAGNITSLKIDTKVGDSATSRTLSVKLDSSGNITDLTDADGIKIYEAHYVEMPNATDFTKIMYGFRLGYWG